MHGHLDVKLAVVSNNAAAACSKKLGTSKCFEPCGTHNCQFGSVTLCS